MYDIENPLVTTIDTMYKEVKKNVVEEANTSTISEKHNTDTVDKTGKSQTSKKQSLPPQKTPTHWIQ